MAFWFLFLLHATPARLHESQTKHRAFERARRWRKGKCTHQLFLERHHVTTRWASASERQKSRYGRSQSTRIARRFGASGTLTSITTNAEVTSSARSASFVRFRASSRRAMEAKMALSRAMESRARVVVSLRSRRRASNFFNDASRARSSALFRARTAVIWLISPIARERAR